MLKFVRALFLCALVVPSLHATTFAVGPDRDMIRDAHAIVVGTALSSYTQIAAYGGIETVSIIALDEVIKGDISGPTVAGGMVFAGSGYPGVQNGVNGNVLLAFGVE